MYKGLTMIEDRLTLKKFISDNKIVSEVFGDKWLKDNLLYAPAKVNYVHPLFFYFSNPLENISLLEGIRYLKEDNRNNIINELKADKDSQNILAKIRQIQTYTTLRKNLKNSLKWEPTIPDSNKKGDIQINHKDKNVYIEIFCINLGMEDKVEKEIVDKLHSKVNEMADNPYVVWINLKNRLQVNDENRIWGFIKKEIKNTRITELPLKKIYFLLISR